MGHDGRLIARRPLTAFLVAALAVSGAVASASPAEAAHRLRSSASTIAGTPRVGMTLTARHGTWTAGTRFTYRWYRDGRAIKGATRSSYRLTPADNGAWVTVRIRGAKPGYTAVTRTSKRVAVHSGLLPNGTVHLIKTNGCGVLRTSRSGWPGGATYYYRWTRDGVAITGATEPSYRCQVADVGHVLRVTLTVKKSGYASKTVTSAEAYRVETGYLTTARPTIVGEPKVGKTLKAVPGAWSSIARLSYQWYRDGKPIGGETSSAYLVTPADLGHALMVTVFGSATGFRSESRQSAPVTVVAGDLASGSVTVTGGTVTGARLEASLAGWPAAAALSYQWLRDGEPIEGATDASYLTTSDDALHSISVAVTGSAPGYTPATVTSNGTTLADWYATNFPTFNTKTQSANGPMDFAVPSYITWAVVTIDYEGAGHFSVTSRDQAGHPTASLSAMSYGNPFHTTLLMRNTDALTKTISVDTDDDATWTIQVKPVSTAPALPSSGIGSGVFRYDGPARIMGITNGPSAVRSFTVSQLHTSGADPTALEAITSATSADGSLADLAPVNAGPSLIVIASSSAWAMTPQ